MTAPIRRRIDLPAPPADQQRILDAGGVACWEAEEVIPTYAPHEPDRYPQFLDRRVYQGSSGRVYPLPFVDGIAATSAPRAWRAIHLVNRWVHLVLLPELGGRIHLGYDRIAEYDFFYGNGVIKPALVGLGGPWVSGGVEFNWPQHHRPATFLPVDTAIERAEDGAVTVWHSDLDPIQRMRARHGITLRGESSLISLEAFLTNRTDEPQTFLWWANVAARAHERYQSFFPTDVRFVADHARRALTAFPRADRPYYGVDYPALAAEQPGADRIDVYSSIPVPTSYMVTDTVDDFFGGYDHDAEAGFVHWADRAIAPGKKQWTWGDGDIGRAWDRQLTDEDGPYVELMAGVFTDNQPDFAWLAPGETKRIEQHWYPIQRIGAAVQASLDAAVGVEEREGALRVGVVTTSVVEGARVRVLPAAGAGAAADGGPALHEAIARIAPGEPMLVDLAITGGRDAVIVEVRDGDRMLVRWAAHPHEHPEPWLATEPPAPADIASADELVQTAQHLVQYRHPTRRPDPYLEEALRRDPGDARAHLLLARLALRRAEYARALDHARASLDRTTARNLNPAHGEAHLLLALVLERLGRLDEAEDAFGKAGWDGALLAPAELGRARLAMAHGDARRAERHARRALEGDPRSSAAVAQLVISLELLDRRGDAAGLLAEARRRDPLDPLLAAVDDALGAEGPGSLDPADPRTLLAMAQQLARMGDAARARTLAERALARPAGPFGNPAPLAALLLRTLGAAGHPAPGTRLCFPAGLDDHDLLAAAVADHPDDPEPHALLACWMLDAGRDADAAALLARARSLGSTDPVAWRNSALASMRTGGDTAEADGFYVRALELAPDDARLLSERDQLAEVRGIAPAERLARLRAAGPAALERSDLVVAQAELLVEVGEPQQALDLLLGRRLQPFEGGEGRAIAVFDRARCDVARALMADDPASAAALLLEGVRVPEGLGEGRHPADPIAERWVLRGDALALIGDDVGARESWTRAVEGGGLLAVAPRTPDERTAWIGTALERLGRHDEAERVWRALEERADELEHGPDIVDYFATSLPELLLFPPGTAERRTRQAAQLRALAAAGRPERIHP